MNEYIYLLQEREFIKTKENIYKIGKTKQENLKRFASYPIGSCLILQIKCDDCHNIEKKVIKLFKEKYELQKDIGNEYFEGNYKDMIDDIYIIIKNFSIINEDTEIKKDDDLMEDTEIKQDDCLFEDTEIKQDDDLMEDTEIKQDDDLMEDTEIENYYIIDTFEKYQEASQEIKKIIITNEKNKSGYLLLKKSIVWHNINKYDYTKDVEDQECLLGWLKHYSEELFIQKRNVFYTKYKYNKIINDLLINYTSITSKIDLPYGTYFISIDIDGYYILNTQTFQMIKYNNEICQILTYDDITCYPLYNKINIKDVNIEFVDNAIKFIINNEDNYNKYCQLTYNVIVEHKKDIILIDDTGYVLANWIKNALDIISSKKLYIDISHNDIIPKKFNQEIRLIFINQPVIIPKLLKLGYKNIMIITNKKIINENYITFIKENKETIVKQSHYDEFNIEEDILYEVFDSRRLLFNNYLKWCCK